MTYSRSPWLLATWLLFSSVLAADCVSQEQPSTTVNSLTGKTLSMPSFEPARRSRLLRQLEQAQELLQQDPDNVDNWIWVGRRLGYLWRYQEAIEIYTRAITKFPNEPALYRHRGHRFITIRRFDRAITDLEKAAELIRGKTDQVEADGMPNAAGVPTSTLHTNIWYHLGLAHYLKQDYPKALNAYQACLAASENDDMKVAALDWMFMTLMRMGEKRRAMEVIAEIDQDTRVIENFAYLRRILMYRGLISPEELLASESGQDRDLNLATYGYGLGNWFQLNGDQERAHEYYRQVVAGKYWSAFGFIAAEAELARSPTGIPESAHGK